MDPTAPSVTNSTNGTTEETTGFPFSHEAAVFVACLLGIMAVFGILANTLTIVVITMSRKLRSVFSLFIISLCASDLASALVSPFFIYRRTWGFNFWMIPDFFCKFSWCIHMWTNYVTAIHIVCFAALRLCAIARPIQFREIKQHHAQICIAVIWFICFLAGGVPLAVMFGVEQDRDSGIVGKFPACAVLEDSLDDFKLYHYVAYPIFFFLPIILVTVISVAVGVFFYKRQKQKQESNLSSVKSVSQDLVTDSKNGLNKINKTKKKAENETFAILQLSLIVGSFLIGYLPFTIYQLYGYTVPPESPKDERNDWNFGISEYILLRFSECLNPIFYNLASKTMRDETKRVLNSFFCWCCRRKANR